jgi:hypothetical protein
MGRALWREAKDWTGAARAVRLGDEDADRDADPRVVCHCPVLSLAPQCASHRTDPNAYHCLTSIASTRMLSLEPPSSAAFTVKK